jgi:hypothetical protein
MANNDAVDASWHIPSASDATTLADTTPGTSEILAKRPSAPQLSTGLGAAPDGTQTTARYTAPIVPPASEHRPRTLVLCFDGTVSHCALTLAILLIARMRIQGDQFDNDVSGIAYRN